MTYRVTLIPGEGTGPELIEATRLVLEATGVPLEWDVQIAGEAALQAEGDPLPARVLESIKANKVALKGPLTTQLGVGFRSVTVRMRQALDLYANVRPAFTIPGVRALYDDLDLVILRENTEGMYAGIEHDVIPGEAAEAIRLITRKGSERIVRYAFEYARAHGRKSVTAVHKANVLKLTDGLFLSVAQKVAAEYPDIPFMDRIVDNMAMQLVQHPQEYDVIVTTNLFGDILSDLAAGLVGGLGLAAGANIGVEAALFEPVHGSAPKYAGQNKVNPTATILAGAMLLRHLGEEAAANRVEAAVRAVIGEGKTVTYDLKAQRDDPTAVGTRQMAEAIAARL